MLRHVLASSQTGLHAESPSVQGTAVLRLQRPRHQRGVVRDAGRDTLPPANPVDHRQRGADTILLLMHVRDLLVRVPLLVPAHNLPLVSNHLLAGTLDPLALTHHSHLLTSAPTGCCPRVDDSGCDERLQVTTEGVA